MKLGRLTDYAVLMLTELARRPGWRASAAEIAAASHVPEPTTAKLAKMLAKAGILDSRRGPGGGFQLARPAAQISVADIIAAIEGPIALIACAEGGGGCGLEGVCATRAAWAVVNQAVCQALRGVSLAQMAVAEPGLDLPAKRAMEC